MTFLSGWAAEERPRSETADQYTELRLQKTGRERTLPVFFVEKDRQKSISVINIYQHPPPSPLFVGIFYNSPTIPFVIQ